MMTSRRANHLIDACIAVQVLLVLGSAIILVGVDRGGALIGLASAVLIGLGWLAYRRLGWVVGIWVLLVGAMLGAFVDAGLVVVLLLLVGLAVLVLEQGLRWAIVASVLMAFYMAALVWWSRRSIFSVLMQSIGNVVVLLIGLAGGLLLHQVRSEQRTNQRLLAELRATTDTEKELMLADERSRSARDLHDGLGHRLTLIAMNLEYAQRIRDKDADAAWTEVAGARAEARDALAYMRRWVRALNPPREPNLAGIEAFEAIADSFRGTGLTVTVSQAGEEQELGREASLFAYRLVQEGLTNVLRHSSADEVSLTLRWLADEVEIELADNGGEPEARENQPGGFGLRSLAERARELGGAFAADATPTGLVLRGRIPVVPLTSAGELR